MRTDTMRVKVLCRNPDEYQRETKRDIHKMSRNYDPALHPFEVGREYTRALNAVKLERMFARPFIGSLDGHRDSISCMVKHPSKLSLILSGSCDGEVRVWDLPQRQCMRSFQAHQGFVRGASFGTEGMYFFTVGDDKSVKRWDLSALLDGGDDEPAETFLCDRTMTGISHHYKRPVFATCGEQCDIWEETRQQPVRSFQWGVDSLQGIKFNPVETSVLATCASDRSIILYDTRETSPLRRVTLQLRSNALSWNPMEAFIFTVANEDYSLYTFDMRNLSRACNVHKDHVSAVIDVDYSPTGREFVAGSYDKTVRIFETSKGHSRDVYHTKRMQRLTCVLWSLDNKYVLSGSDEMNVRVWKARASEKLGVLKHREKSSLEYNQKLKEKFLHHPQVRRVAQHRHVPKAIVNAKREIKVMTESRKRKEANRRAHSKPGSVPYQDERRKHVIGEKE